MTALSLALTLTAAGPRSEEPVDVRGESDHVVAPEVPGPPASPPPSSAPETTVAGFIAGEAVRLAARTGAVITEEDGDPCVADLLVVSWDEPDDRYEVGAYIAPVGPVPDEQTTAVNGVVLCDGYDHAYMGFEAVLDDEGWRIFEIPDPDAGSGHADGDEGSSPREVLEPPPAPSGVSGTTTGPIEGYAAYQPQRTCDPTAKPGTLALRDMLLSRYPGSRNYGIVRSCMIGGRSEHKEGRAFDWGVHVNRPAEREAAEDFIRWLLATDEAGNRHAMARRMGVMYVIWNRQIWSAHSPNAWRGYNGASPHIDHVHISLSWDGAMGRTSFWSGDHSLAEGMAPPPASPERAAPLPGGTPSSRSDDDGRSEDDRPERAVRDDEDRARHDDDERRSSSGGGQADRTGGGGSGGTTGDGGGGTDGSGSSGKSGGSGSSGGSGGSGSSGGGGDANGDAKSGGDAKGGGAGDGNAKGGNSKGNGNGGGNGNGKGNGGGNGNGGDAGGDDSVTNAGSTGDGETKGERGGGGNGNGNGGGKGGGPNR